MEWRRGNVGEMLEEEEIAYGMAGKRRRGVGEKVRERGKRERQKKERGKRWGVRESGKKR